MTHYQGRILIIDDDTKICAFYMALLGSEGFLVDCCSDLKGMREQIGQYSYDAVLLDLRLGHEYGLDGLPFLLKNAPYAKVFIFSAESTVEKAVECMQRGATSFFTKTTEPSLVVAEIKKQLVHHLSDLVTDDEPFNLKSMLVGESKAIQELIHTIEKIKNVDSTILILGESGTGKEVVARAIHQTSDRAKRRFQAINCGAIPENLLETELFGHKRGAFTDAKTDRKGIFEICSDGTLLLDEIGDMPITLQTKLLRVLQEKQITPVGSAVPVNINTRVIAATHRDVLDEVKSGRFREDLFFRLSVVVFRIPPLRHRIEDLPILINHFLSQFNNRFGKNVRPPSNAVMARLMAYDWPGNIRELQNALERGVVLASGDELDLRDMFQHLETTNEAQRTRSQTFEERAFSLPLTDAKQFFEKAYLEHLLVDSNGNISEVARKSGRFRADIYRLMERYGFDQNSFRS